MWLSLPNLRRYHCVVDNDENKKKTEGRNRLICNFRNACRNGMPFTQRSLCLVCPRESVSIRLPGLHIAENCQFYIFKNFQMFVTHFKLTNSEHVGGQKHSIPGLLSFNASMLSGGFKLENTSANKSTLK